MQLREVLAILQTKSDARLSSLFLILFGQTCSASENLYQTNFAIQLGSLITKPLFQLGTDLLRICGKTGQDQAKTGFAQGANAFLQVGGHCCLSWAVCYLIQPNLHLHRVLLLGVHYPCWELD